MSIPKIIDNINDKLLDDLSDNLNSHSQLAVTASDFSLYAYVLLKKKLDKIQSMRFLFSLPTFLEEKESKEKREFYIPRLNREQNLYGTPYELKLRNSLTQRDDAKECASWITNKAVFKSNKTKGTISQNCYGGR